MSWPLGFALAVQAVAGEPAGPPHTYLHGAEARRPCEDQRDSGEVVVCARKRDDEAYRLRSPEGDYAAPPVRAELRVGGIGTLRASVAGRVLMPGERKSQPDKPGARYAKQPMISLAIPLGGGSK